jgi:hypothetical protein
MARRPPCVRSIAPVGRSRRQSECGVASACGWSPLDRIWYSALAFFSAVLAAAGRSQTADGLAWLVCAPPRT